MVAISLYKGNLHKVSDLPRKWVMPQRQISLKDFRTLLRRRNRGLSQHLSTDDACTVTTLITATVSGNPNPDSDTGNHDAEPERPQLKDKQEESEEKAPVFAKADLDEDAVEWAEGGDGSGKIAAEVADSVVNESKHEVVDHNTVVEREVKNVTEDQQVKMDEKAVGEIQTNPNIKIQESNEEDAQINKDKRKKEVEEKLLILKEKKHGLVQVLKQILSAEEELKQHSMQGMASRSSVPLHVDIPNDTGSMTRLNTPRMGSDGILIGEVEGEPDGMSNQNADSQHLLRLSSQSPSSDSQHKKLPSYVIPHSARTTQGVIGSPSRFAPMPTAQQGNPSNLPSVSISGTNYIASSPSPAASGGTSVFRESRIPSPWN